MDKILLAAIIIAFVIVLVVVFATGSHRSQKKYETASIPHVTVKNGVNIKTLNYGREKGDVFDQREIRRGTVLINGATAKECTALFYNFGTKQEQTVYFHKQMIIGRSSGKNSGIPRLVIHHDRLISRDHCVIRIDKDHLELSDFNSENHTYINDHIVSKPTVLQDGDIITVGYTRLCIHFQIV